MSLPFLGYNGAIWVDQTDRNDLSWIFGTSTGKEYYNVSHMIGRKTMKFSLPISLKSLAVNGGVLCSDAFDDCSSLENISIGISTKSVPSALVAGHYGDSQLF